MQVDATDIEGQQPLHLSAMFGHVRAAAALIDCGALPDAVDQRGWTSLRAASEFNRKGVVMYLKPYTDSAAEPGGLVERFSDALEPEERYADVALPGDDPNDPLPQFEDFQGRGDEDEDEVRACARVRGCGLRV